MGLRCTANHTIDTFVFLRSDIDPAILVYRFDFADSSSIAIADPSDIVLSLPGTAGVSTLQTSVIETKGGSIDAFQHAQFFNVTTLHKDFSVQQTLYVASAAGYLTPELVPPTWQRDLTKSIHKVSEDDFVVDDEEHDETHTELLNTEPASNFAKRLKGQQHATIRDWTVNYEHTVQHLNELDVSDVTDIDEVLEIVQETLKNSGVDNHPPFGIIRELAEGEITLQDIDSISTRLERLLSDHNASQTRPLLNDEIEHEPQGSRLTLQSVFLPPSLGVSGDGEFGSAKIVFERISKSWLSPATQTISDMVRHSREQLARRVAIEVCLASLMIRREDAAKEELRQSHSQTESQGQAWELPVRPGAPPSNRTTPSLYFDASSQVGSSRLPTPSDSASMSIPTSANSAIARLSRYTAFTGKPSPPSLPRRLNRVLAHWTIGADPASYDWTLASQHISRRDEEEAEGEELTEKERARLQRRTERYVRRQRREAEETQRMQLLSSQAPEIVSGSQPGQLVRAASQLGVSGGESQSQSQSQSQGRSKPQAVASQVLPGRHGGRPPKKKKRKSGF